MLRIANTCSLALAGQLFNTLVGSQSQQQRGPSSETSPHYSLQGSQERLQANTEEQQVAGAGEQQLFSGSREGGTVQQSERQARRETQQNQDEDDMEEQWNVQHQQSMHPP